jgi:crossover junction endodeoxyribonuclease RuvC
MGVAQISGVTLALAYRNRIPVAFYTPTQVKAAVTGSGRADKAQVGFMVAKILKLAEPPKPADAADSLAIAICHAWNAAGAPTKNSDLTAAQKSWLAALAKAKGTNR